MLKLINNNAIIKEVILVNLVEKMEEYARNNFVPIARKDNISFLQNLIKEEKLYNILELGSAIGYSAICMASVNELVKVTTIERNENLYNEAVKNIKEAKLEDRVNIILDDIFNVDIKEKFDLIFIDAAKAQYIKFFEKFSGLLNEKGVIISDNIDLLDLQKLTDSKKSKRLVEKMKDYKKYLVDLKEYETVFLNIGDGFALTRKK